MYKIKDLNNRIEEKKPDTICLKTFYKKITYTCVDKNYTINTKLTIVENYNIWKTQQKQLKYIKYKIKYLNLKNK
jgi:hypothetical protein